MRAPERETRDPLDQTTYWDYSEGDRDPPTDDPLEDWARALSEEDR